MTVLLIKRAIQLVLPKLYESRRVKAVSSDLQYENKKKLILNFGRLYKCHEQVYQCTAERLLPYKHSVFDKGSKLRRKERELRGNITKCTALPARTFTDHPLEPLRTTRRN